ncbi:hypothetical protein EXIGLDRAFT_579150, partial [Exidia glandulosa HHB12029]
PPMPPVPFADFDFSFDASLQPLLPDSLQVPPSADLFSPTETTTLLGFLDNFAFDFPVLDDPFAVSGSHTPQQDAFAPSYPTADDTANPMQLQAPVEQQQLPIPSSSATETPGSSSSASPPPASAVSKSSAAAASKKQLTTPQKRLNHIMSEQKRRNAIRDGYATLTQMLAPAGTTITNALPRRGRPRGSGARGKGRGKGKSGVLFRAVEYIAWLQENCDALEQEIARVES